MYKHVLIVSIQWLRATEGSAVAETQLKTSSIRNCSQAQLYLIRKPEIYPRATLITSVYFKISVLVKSCIKIILFTKLMEYQIEQLFKSVLFGLQALH